MTLEEVSCPCAQRSTAGDRGLPMNTLPLQCPSTAALMLFTTSDPDSLAEVHFNSLESSSDGFALEPGFEGQILKGRRLCRRHAQEESHLLCKPDNPQAQDKGRGKPSHTELPSKLHAHINPHRGIINTFKSYLMFTLLHRQCNTLTAIHKFSIIYAFVMMVMS